MVAHFSITQLTIAPEGLATGDVTLNVTPLLVDSMVETADVLLPLHPHQEPLLPQGDVQEVTLLITAQGEKAMAAVTLNATMEPVTLMVEIANLLQITATCPLTRDTRAFYKIKHILLLKNGTHAKNLWIKIHLAFRKNKIYKKFKGLSYFIF